MEADIYLRAYEAVESGAKVVQLPVRHVCAVSKVVWSSFDYMSGPELRFTFEATASAELTPTERTSTSESSRDGSSSLTSSVSKDGSSSTAGYEDIDDAFQADLLTTAVSELEVCVMCMRVHETGVILCDNCMEGMNGTDLLPLDRLSRADRPRYLDEFMTESRSTLEGTNTTIADDDDHLIASSASTSRMGESEVLSDGETGSSDDRDVDSGLRRKAECSAIKLQTSSTQSSPARRLNRVVTDADRRESAVSTNQDCVAVPERVEFGSDPLTAVNSCFAHTPQDLSLLLATSEGTLIPERGEETAVEASRLLTPSTATTTDSTSSAVTVLTQASSFSVIPDDATPQDENPAKQAAMTSSGVDSGITGTISTHSDLSVWCASLPQEASSERTVSGEPSTAQCVSSKAAGMSDSQKMDEGFAEDDSSGLSDTFGFDDNAAYEALVEMAGEAVTLPQSDEEFIAKFVLAEQICSTQMPSNPLMHKITLVPKRRLLAGSYLFPVKRNVGREKAMCAISLIAPHTKYDWYMHRQETIEEMFSDAVPRLKASYLTENLEDFVCRLMSELSRILSVLGVAERYPLFDTVCDLQLKQTYLCEGKLRDNTFLAKAITALLMSQAHCVVVGDRHRTVAKMLHTLFLFVSEQWRWSSVKAFKHPYSPYLRLHAVRRSELASMLVDGVESHWPMAVIDIDRRVVCTAQSYAKHRLLKAQRQREDVGGILRAAGVDIGGSALKHSKLEMHNCRADVSVREFLAKMDLLPFDANIRFGFVRQFLLGVENRARAFLVYVADVSKPHETDKRSAISNKWSVSAARKALDLTSESAYGVVLAEAERLHADVAEFVCAFASS